ncbi:MAG TPA: mechanosensitive ion channel family protein [Kofleriaceae bacterium]
MTPELWWAAALLAATVVTAAAVNRFVPVAKSRVRRSAIVFVLYALSLGITLGLRFCEADAWANRFEIATELLRAFALVGVAGTLVFAIFFKLVGLSIPTIASDLLVGVAYIVTALGVFTQHGLDPLSAFATAGVVSAVLAFSLQSTLGNIIGGVALQLDGSIHEGDWIQLENGKQGKVRAIRWRHTLVETRDFSTIVVPNAQLLANNITILGWRETAPAPQRMWVWFNVDFRHPPSKVIDIVTDALTASPIDNVAPDPKPNCVCMDFAKDGRDSFACYAARYWILDLAPDDPTNSRVRTRIYAALGRAGIALAVPATANLVQMHDPVHAQQHHERDIDRNLKALANVSLFHTLSAEELRVLAEDLWPASYAVGEKITRQGAVAHWLYILTTGKVEIRRRTPDGEEAQLVAKLDAPDIIGEMGLMTGAPRGADVVAMTPCECLRLGKPAFEKVLGARPEIAKELASKLATRRIGLYERHDDLDAAQSKQLHLGETEKILRGIKDFFGL